MKTFTFVIGTMDDFENVDALQDWAEEAASGNEPDGNAQYWEFDCPDNCSAELVMAIGRGFAFSNDWCADGTISFFVNGALSECYVEDEEKTEVQKHDLWEIE